MEIITQKNALGLQNLGLLWHVAEWQRMATAGEILTKKGTKYSSTSVIAINKLINWLGQYQDSKARTLNISDVCRIFSKDFEVFLSSKEISLNYKSSILGLLVTFFNHLEEVGLLHEAPKVNRGGQELTTKIYLTWSELQAMKNACSTKFEIKNLDIFLLQCFTGLRFSTLQKFIAQPMAYIKEYNGAFFIEILEEKVKKDVCVPVGAVVAEILERNGWAFKTIDDSTINKAMKALAGKAGINGQIIEHRTIKGVLTSVARPKNELISTHTARRTFVSLAKQSELSAEQIMASTGHATETQLNQYNRSSALDKLGNAFENAFFARKLADPSENTPAE